MRARLVSSMDTITMRGSVPAPPCRASVSLSCVTSKRPAPRVTHAAPVTTRAMSIVTTALNHALRLMARTLEPEAWRTTALGVDQVESHVTGDRVVALPGLDAVLDPVLGEERVRPLAADQGV